VKSHRQFTIAVIQRHANKRWRILRRGGWRVSTNLYPLFDDLLLLDLPTICCPRRQLAFANVPPSCQASAEELGASLEHDSHILWRWLNTRTLIPYKPTRVGHV
jgi:hypothetical protein